MALTVFSLGAPIGAWVGYNVAGAIADHYGWRAVFFALGIPGVLAGLAVWLTVREPQRGCLDSGDDGEAPSVGETMRFLWQQRSAVHVMMGTAVCALWGWGLMFWTPTFLQRTYHMSVGEAGVTDAEHAPVGRRDRHPGHRLAHGPQQHGRCAPHRVAARRGHRASPRSPRGWCTTRAT